jgi:hypothetical protein
MSARSPLTAALRQRSRRPARHVVCLPAVFSDGVSEVNEISLEPKRSRQAEQEGAFFSRESGEKNRTGWVGQSVSLFN